MKQNDDILGKSKDMLANFKDFVLKWQKSVNLISLSTIPNIWERHVLDSAQLYAYMPQGAKIMVDMGSGGGFPGIVLAIMNKKLTGSLEKIYLIESDLKKSIFLKEATRIFDLPVEVITDRLENVQIENVDVVTARALKELDEILMLGQGFIGEKTTCLFLKGERVDEEISKNTHLCKIEKIKSKLHENSFILKVGEIKR